MSHCSGRSPDVMLSRFSRERCHLSFEPHPVPTPPHLYRLPDQLRARIGERRRRPHTEAKVGRSYRKLGTGGCNHKQPVTEVLMQIACERTARCGSSSSFGGSATALLLASPCLVLCHLQLIHKSRRFNRMLTIKCTTL